MSAAARTTRMDLTGLPHTASFTDGGSGVPTADASPVLSGVELVTKAWLLERPPLGGAACSSHSINCLRHLIAGRLIRLPHLPDRLNIWKQLVCHSPCRQVCLRSRCCGLQVCTQVQTGGASQERHIPADPGS